MKPSIDGKDTRCFYGLTLGEEEVPAGGMRRIEKAVIQDDIVTVVSAHDDLSGAPDALEAAEAVAVAAAACTLGEHHTLTMEGVAVVVVESTCLGRSGTSPRRSCCRSTAWTRWSRPT